MSLSIDLVKLVKSSNQLETEYEKRKWRGAPLHYDRYDL